MLFPGDSDYTQRRDQLNVIFDVIGTPSEEESSYISSVDTKEYLKSLPKKKQKRFSKLLPRASRDAVDLFSKLLMFDPRKRITASEALHHPYLQEVLPIARTFSLPQFRPILSL